MVDRLAAVGTPGTRSGKGAGAVAPSLVVEEKSFVPSFEFEAFIVGGSFLDACAELLMVDMAD